MSMSLIVWLINKCVKLLDKCDATRERHTERNMLNVMDQEITIGCTKWDRRWADARVQMQHPARAKKQ